MCDPIGASLYIRSSLFARSLIWLLLQQIGSPSCWATNFGQISFNVLEPILLMGEGAAGFS